MVTTVMKANKQIYTTFYASDRKYVCKHLSFPPQNKIRENFWGWKTDAHWQSNKWNYIYTTVAKNSHQKRPTLKMCFSFIPADAFLYVWLYQNQKHCYYSPLYSKHFGNIQSYIAASITHIIVDIKSPPKIALVWLKVASNRSIKQELTSMPEFSLKINVKRDLVVWEMVSQQASLIFYCRIFATLSASFLMKFQVQLDHFFEIK